MVRVFESSGLKLCSNGPRMVLLPPKRFNVLQAGHLEDGQSLDGHIT